MVVYSKEKCDKSHKSLIYKEEYITERMHHMAGFSDKCPFTGEKCSLNGSSYPTLRVEASSVGGDGVVGLRGSGEATHLADLDKATPCSMVGTDQSVTIEVGARVPVRTDGMGVATRIGATASNPCVDLNPWG